MNVDLDRLRAEQMDYETSDDTKRKLGSRVLTCVVAPRATGKSFLINNAIKTMAPFETIGLAPTLTTRERRYGVFGEPDPEPAVFRTRDEGMTAENLARRIRAREVVNYSVHPNGTIYATNANDISTKYNMLPTLPSSLPAIRRAGFERMETVFVTASVNDWRNWLSQRMAHDWEEEAIDNLEYAQRHAEDLSFVHNSRIPGGKEKAVSDLIDITLDMPHVHSNAETGLRVVGAMLKFAKYNALQKQDS